MEDMKELSLKLHFSVVLYSNCFESGADKINLFEKVVEA